LVKVIVMVADAQNRPQPSNHPPTLQ